MEISSLSDFSRTSSCLGLDEGNRSFKSILKKSSLLNEQNSNSFYSDPCPQLRNKVKFVDKSKNLPISTVHEFEVVSSSDCEIMGKVCKCEIF
jgi:hypothetical protein